MKHHYVSTFNRDKVRRDLLSGDFFITRCIEKTRALPDHEARREELLYLASSVVELVDEVGAWVLEVNDNNDCFSGTAYSHYSIINHIWREFTSVLATGSMFDWYIMYDLERDHPDLFIDID